MTDIVDAKQRLQALDTTKSFAVAAPAGSGKTGLLIQRVLKLLASASNPEEILCLTFTRKAAGEMRQRIVSALLSANQPEPGEPHLQLTWQLAKRVIEQDAKQGWQLVQSPNRLRITTIDSFCRNLAQQLGPLSGISEGLTTLDNAESSYAEAVTNIVIAHLESDSPLGEAIRTLLIHQDNNLNRVNDLLIALLQNREQWLGHLIESKDARKKLEGYLQQTIIDTLQKLSTKLQPITGELLMLADYAASHVLGNNDTENPLACCVGISELTATNTEQLFQWLGIAHLLLTAKGELRKSGGINKKIGFPTAKDDPEFGATRKDQIKALLQWCNDQNEVVDLLVDLRNLPAVTYPDDQWQVLQSLCVLLPVLAAELKTLFTQQNQCDFTEITLAALESLGSEEQPTDLALRLDYAIKHILVDEFQDTSTIQYQLLEALVRGWQPGDGRSLFIVGDGMQSLYSFRNANVGLFLKARTQSLGEIKLTPLDLLTNFRSHQGVVDWVNEAFVESFPVEDNINRGAVRYSPSQAVKPRLPEPAVTIDGFFDHANSQAEAEKVVQHINAAKQNNPEGSIAILVRDRGYLKQLLPVLRAAGLSWTARDIEPLASQMSVIDLLSLTRALLNPADRIAWLALLRAPWCGLNLIDLYQLTNTDLGELNPKPSKARFPLIYLQLLHFKQITGLSTEGQQILTRIVPWLQQAFESRQQQPLRTSIEELWAGLGGKLLENHYHSPGSANAFFNLLEQHEVAGSIENWLSFTLAVNKLYAQAKPDSDPLLQIMTLHKAKGLEFDTVIIPGTNRKSAPGSKPLLMWREGISQQGLSQLIISPVESTGENQDRTYQHLKYEQKNKERLENNRVLYVGATRAIKQLHLLFSIKSNSKPNAGSLLASLWPWLEKKLEEDSVTNSNISYLISKNTTTPTDEDAQPNFNPMPVINSLSRLKPGIDLPGVKTMATSNIPDNSTTETEDTEASITGTLLHRILRQITLDGIANWCKQTLLQRRKFWQLQLQHMGSLSIDHNLALIHTALEQVLQDSQNHWIFDHSHPQSACEYALGYQDGSGNYRKAILDRTFVHSATSTRWIIDYKLSQLQSDETLQQFLARQQACYQQQLAAYARLFKSHESLPIKTALYFPLQSHLLVINSN